MELYQIFLIKLVKSNPKHILNSTYKFGGQKDFTYYREIRNFRNILKYIQLFPIIKQIKTVVICGEFCC